MQSQVRDIFVFLFVFLIFFNLVSGIEVGASPSKIRISLFEEEYSCYKIKVFSSYNEQGVNVVDVWGSKNSLEFSDYKLDSKDFQININYDSEFILKEKEDFNFCIKALKEGTYFGLIEFYFEEASAVIITKIELVVIPKDSFSKITGGIILGSDLSNKVFLQLALLFSLLFVFIFLLIKLKNK